VIPLGDKARKRHYHEAEKGRVTRFTVQLEVLVNNEWRVVIRYDVAHGFAHIDEAIEELGLRAMDWRFQGR